MHPRNPYKETPPDFAALAARDQDFARFVRPSARGQGMHIDWSDHAAVLALTRALLRHDFGVVWEMPADRLCPTVPSRLNYLLWLEDLVTPAAISATTAAPADARARVMCVDIGTGASCIYPLLGVAKLNWDFIATELDGASAAAAKRNVSLNGWESRIDVRHVATPSTSADGSTAQSPVQTPAPLLRGVLGPDETADCSMCNPPFYDDGETPRGRADHDGARCVGSRAEQFTPGGEVGFVTRMIDESVEMGGRIRWYSSLLGKKASLKPLLAALRDAHVPRVRTTEIAQGVTSRWAIAWSLSPLQHGDGASAFSEPAPEGAPRKVFGAGSLSALIVCDRAVEALRRHGARVIDTWTAGARVIDTWTAGELAADETTAPRPTLPLHAVLPLTAGEGAKKRQRDDGERGGDGAAEPVELCVRLCEMAGSHESSGASPELFVEVLMCGSVGRSGKAIAAFWQLAERVRNDIVRDTRKWRRQKAQ